MSCDLFRQDGGEGGGEPIVAQPTSANDSTHVENDTDKLMKEADPNTPIVLGPPGGDQSYGSI